METTNGRHIELDNTQTVDVWETTFPGDEEVHFWLMYELDLQEYWAGWSEVGIWSQVIAPMGDCVPSREEVEELFLRLRHNVCDCD